MTETSDIFLNGDRLDLTGFDESGKTAQWTETHISWVVLTDRHAFKIKKPVRFGFLDFSTLDKRKNFCEREFSLNSVFSPELYLGVVSLSSVNEKIRLTQSGEEPVEYAVKMKRFDSNALYRTRIENNRLTLAELESLAEAVAGIHRLTAAADPESDFGTLERFIYWNNENFDAIRERIDDDKSLSRVMGLQAFMNDFIHNNESLLKARKDDGFIRDCHGDLHLGNVIWSHGQARLFDRIEFNDELRFIDVINDIAFTVMDLFYYRRSDLAWQFLNRYLRQTGDYAGILLVGMYGAYRALVRAKVTLLTNDQDNGTTGIPPDFLRHLDIAEKMIRCGDSGASHVTLTITCGLSGSGKSYCAGRLSGEWGAVIVQSDVERKRMAGLDAREPGKDRITEGLYSRQSSDNVYQKLITIADQVLADGYPVIVDAAFLRRSDRDRFRSLAARHKVPFSILFCQASPETLRQRIIDRTGKGDPSDATIEVLEHQLITAELPAEDEAVYIDMRCN
ncbi:MAG: hypothetical protein DHS20C01_19260 [marine bacterium B5-7]|nr:MAG: hypothetical protein DHS20C01_19260 [marine bacterium B5-7]